VKYLNILLKVKNEKRSVFQIILWWELRRILYNIIVLLSLGLSILLMLLAASKRVNLEPGEDFIEPFMILIFIFLCNLGYTFGWITEISKNKNVTYGPDMFKIGLYFTLFWVFLPAFLWVIVAIIDLIKGII
jgi:hypothetical protein